MRKEWGWEIIKKIKGNFFKRGRKFRKRGGQKKY